MSNVYNFASAAAIGKPCRVFDATGEEIPWVTWCNVSTGEVERLETDEYGKFVGPDCGMIRKIRETRPAPLRLEVYE